MTAPLNEAQAELLRMIVWNADRLETGTCPNIYSRFGATLRALAARGLVTFKRHGITAPAVYEATPTPAGREAVAS